jgi:hypothetical protein
MSAAAATPGTAVRIEFADGAVGATIDDAGGKPAPPRNPVSAKPPRGGGSQGSLF